MARLAKPRGGVRIGNALITKPRIRRLHVGCPAKILFICDLHLRREHPEMAEIALDACNELKPDLILMGGDLTEYDEGLEIWLKALRLRFPAVFCCAVPGNNDDAVFGGDRERQGQMYETYGVEYLLNRAVSLEIGHHRLEIAGLEDGYTHEPDYTGLFSKDEGVFRVLLAHEPLKGSICPDADLLLFGHTHGGQINLLGVTCYLPGYETCFDFEYLAGVKRKGKQTILVSRGIGYSKLPVRVGADGEVHFID